MFCKRSDVSRISTDCLCLFKGKDEFWAPSQPSWAVLAWLCRHRARCPAQERPPPFLMAVGRPEFSKPHPGVPLAWRRLASDKQAQTNTSCLGLRCTRNGGGGGTSLWTLNIFSCILTYHFRDEAPRGVGVMSCRNSWTQNQDT